VSLTLSLKGSLPLKLFEYLLYLLRYDKKCDENLTKHENALLETNSKVVFSTFFLLKLSESNPLKGLSRKKATNVLYVFFLISKNIFLHQNYLATLKF
jgi:hypothetical protein